MTNLIFHFLPLLNNNFHEILLCVLLTLRFLDVLNHIGLSEMRFVIFCNEISNCYLVVLSCLL